ncbi:MAG: hypothetical protein ACRCY8_19590 [Dermatophilaceae bacterium]
MAGFPATIESPARHHRATGPAAIESPAAPSLRPDSTRVATVTFDW